MHASTSPPDSDALAASERRSVLRRPLSITATAHAPSGPFPMRVTSGSPHGLWIEDAPVLPSGFAFHLTLAVADGPLEAIAMVLRSTPDGTAVRLTVPHAHDRERWRGHLRAVPLDLSIGDLDVHWDPRELFDFNWSNELDADPSGRWGSEPET